MRNRVSKLVLLLSILAAATSLCHAKSLEARISVLSLSPARVQVEGETPSPTKVWSFRNGYASLMGLAERIENLKLADADGVEVPVQKLAPGEYEAARAATRWRYEIKLDPPLLSSDAIYASWIANERGFLMLGDLLPQTKREGQAAGDTVLINLSLPATWTAVSNETKRGNWQFEVADKENAVFYIGSNLRERREQVGAMAFTVVTNGTWAFSDNDVMDMAADILKHYHATVGVAPHERVMLMLSPFPRPVTPGRWSAETKGKTVVLLSGQWSTKINGLAHLSAPLTHELFHLWVPNGLSLDGNYDWFYEGFTVYLALYTAVRLGLLTFEDFLFTLSRGYDAYASASDRNNLSLLEASQRRWTGSTMLVYRKGMLVAFLYDFSLRYASKGKQSLDSVYRALFLQSKKVGTRSDGNNTIIPVLKSQTGMQDFIHRYVESADEIELQSLIAPFGLRLERQGARSQISVASNLSRRQRDLLSVFGYNK